MATDYTIPKDEYRALIAENAKLRGVVASLADRSFRMADKMNLLQSENAKLREEVVELRKSSQTYDAENAKLREAFNATLIRLSAANDAAGGGFMDSRYCELLRELGIEVDG